MSPQMNIQRESRNIESSQNGEDYQDEIYFDNAATTMMAPEVREAMVPWLGAGNPSSLHSAGAEAKGAVEDSRKVIADSIGAKQREIIFTSGGTESNNLALKGFAFANRNKGDHIITTKIEHKSILNTCSWLEKQGFKVTYLDVDNEGHLSPELLESAITPKTILVSVIHGNNEIGTIQPLAELGAVCKKHGVAFHTDACQSYTKTEIDVVNQSLTMVTLNAHKIHGPKGVGALYLKSGTPITPLLHGGPQERRKRGGTENVAGIVGFAKSINVITKQDIERMRSLRNRLIEGVISIPDLRLNGPREDRLCNNVNISVSRIEGEAIVGRLDLLNILCSTGSACSEASLEPSYVLKAIGLSDQEANGSLRITLSKYSTEEEVDRFISVLPGVIEKLRAISPIGRE